MSYPHYTECVEPHKYQSSPIGQTVAAGLFAAMSGIVGSILITGGLSALTGEATAFLTIVVSLLTFCHWWLYGRLVCLEGQRCAVGMVISVEPPENKTWFERFDSDYSFNILLTPHHIGDKQEKIEADGYLGELIKGQDATKNIGLPCPGYTSSGPNCGDPSTAVLHCEIEGAGMYILYQWLKALTVILSIATAASWFCWVPIIGWIACLIAEVLTVSAILSFLAGIKHALSDAASPSDIDPSLGGSLHWGCNGDGADLVVVGGEWIYDSFHDGWNELHPVNHLQKVGRWSGNWPFSARWVNMRWCGAIANASAPLTQQNQKKPENQWRLHPTVDGCEPDEADFVIRITPEVGVTTPGKTIDYVVSLFSMMGAASPSSVTFVVESGLTAQAVPTFIPSNPQQPPANITLSISTTAEIIVGTDSEFLVRATDTNTNQSTTTTARIVVIAGID